MTRLFFIAMLTQVISWFLVLISNPELSSKLPSVDRLGKLFLFIPIAWGLKKYENPLKYVFLISLCGFFIGIIINSDFLFEISSAIKGERVYFGIRNAQHPSMIFGLIFIISFLNLFVFGKLEKKAVFFLAVILFLSFCGLIFTQTRQSYLALIICFVVTFPIIFKSGYKFKKIFLIFLVIVISAFIFKLNMGDFSERTGDIKAVWISLQKIWHKDTQNINFEEKIDFYVNNIASTSTGIRLKSWLESVKWIIHKPFFGWGSQARKLVIKKSDNFTNDFKNEYGHLHNYFIEVLVSYGVCGLFIILLMYWIFLGSLYKVRNIGNGKNIFVTGFCFVVYWIVINNFESFNSFWTGVFAHNIFLGALYSRYLNLKVK
ncbi:MAG: O-antigen ligase family protein [Desulforegulaceae bacterium]|nr:O-antigen ligase family protein [Desulforegulaceae bacterium]